MLTVKWEVRARAWEDTDFIVTIRPEFEKPWHDVPIGGVLDQDTAERIAAWLDEGGLAALWRIAENVATAKAKGEWPPAT